MPEILDKDYLEYKRGMGHWTKEQEMLWDYLTVIVNLLSHIVENSKMVQLKEDPFKKVDDSLKTGIPPMGARAKEKPSRVPQVRLE